jgi:hypothetical protein
MFSLCSPSSYIKAAGQQAGGQSSNKEVPIGISFTTSVITTTGGRVKFISKIDVFMGVS